jgi:hypothetical protein
VSICVVAWFQVKLDPAVNWEVTSSPPQKSIFLV